MAGGIFLVPFLTTAAHLSFGAAVAISLVSVVACSCASSPTLLVKRLTNIRLVIVLEIAASLGALVGLLAVGAVSERVLYGLFAAVLVLSAAQMLQPRRGRSAPTRAEPTSWATRLRLHSSLPGPASVETPYTVRGPGAGLAAMFGAGVLSTLLGIGSGVLKIPAMDMALRLPLKVSSATANLMIGITAAGAAAAVVIRGDVDLGFAAPVVVGSVLGSVLGAKVLVRANPAHLRVVFFAVLVLLAVPMTLTAAGITSVGA
ncbi:TSUP family transporter [Rhodococcus hoagii]|nr:TSUP family transporter [Prescottella equi]